MFWRVWGGCIGCEWCAGGYVHVVWVVWMTDSYVGDLRVL